MKIIIYILLFLFIHSPSALSLEHLTWNKNRPIHIEDAYPVEKCKFTFQQGFHLQKNKRGEPTWDFISELLYGINDRLHIGAEGRYRFIDSKTRKNRDGFGDTKFFFLYNFYGSKEELKGVSIKGEASIPTANSPLGTRGRDYTITALASKTSRQLGVHANLSYTRIGKDPLRDYTYFYGAALDYPIKPNIALLWNIFVKRTPWQGENLIRTIEGGILYQVNQRLVLDTSIGTGLRDTKNNLDFSWTSGLSLFF